MKTTLTETEILNRCCEHLRPWLQVELGLGNWIREVYNPVASSLPTVRFDLARRFQGDTLFLNPPAPLQGELKQEPNGYYYQKLFCPEHQQCLLSCSTLGCNTEKVPELIVHDLCSHLQPLVQAEIQAGNVIDRFENLDGVACLTFPGMLAEASHSQLIPPSVIKEEELFPLSRHCYYQCNEHAQQVHFREFFYQPETVFKQQFCSHFTSLFTSWEVMGFPVRAVGTSVQGALSIGMGKPLPGWIVEWVECNVLAAPLSWAWDSERGDILGIIFHCQEHQQYIGFPNHPDLTT